MKASAPFPWFRGTGALILTLWVVSGMAPAVAASGSPPAVATVAVQAQTTAVRFEFDGVVEPVRQAIVSAQASGRIQSVLVRAGEPVRAGQVLAVIDDRDAVAGVERVRAQGREADAALRQAQANFERLRQLRQQDFISQAALDAAQTQVKAAQASREQVDAALVQAQLGQGHTRVTAPFDGFVRETQAEAGDLATPGRPVVLLYAPQPLRVVVRVGASRQSLAQQATDVQVQRTDAEWVSIAQHQLLPTVDGVSQTREWRLELPRAASSWVPGQQVRVRLLGSGEVLTRTLDPARAIVQVPRTAVVRRGELSAVYVATEGGFAMRAVRVGRDLGNGSVEVAAGLRAGERIAIDGLRASQVGARPAP